MSANVSGCAAATSPAPFAAAGAENWLIGFAGMQSGDRFTLMVSAVPEPGSWALALVGAGRC